MPRQAFFSFHFDNDSWRAGQVRNMGAVEGDEPVSDNDWEAIKRGGNAAIEHWIEGQMARKTVCIVLVGSQTAGRPWIDHEIKRAWALKKGLLGIRVHGLKNSQQRTDLPGANPFANFNLNGVAFDGIVPLHSPAGFDSQGVYASIRANLSDWVEEAIAIRNRYA